MTLSAKDVKCAEGDPIGYAVRVQKWISPFAVLFFTSCSTLSLLETPFSADPTAIDAVARRHQLQMRSEFCFASFILSAAIATVLLYRARRHSELDRASRLVTSAIAVFGGVVFEIFLLFCFLSFTRHR